jgi:hypothetical protein
LRGCHEILLLSYHNYSLRLFWNSKNLRAY